MAVRPLGSVPSSLRSPAAISARARALAQAFCWYSCTASLRAPRACSAALFGFSVTGGGAGGGAGGGLHPASNAARAIARHASRGRMTREFRPLSLDSPAGVKFAGETGGFAKCPRLNKEVLLWPEALPNPHGWPSSM